MHHPRYKSPAGLFTPGILHAREESGSHRQNKLKGNSSPLWFVGLWCVLASQMLLIHKIYLDLRGTGKIHIQKTLYLLEDIRYKATCSSRSSLSYKSSEKEGSKSQVSPSCLVFIFEHQLLLMTTFSNSEHLQLL